MIRDRRDEDLDRLVAVLDSMERPATLAQGQDLRDWLTEHRTARSWVFDQAPVTAAPTRNVVGHVQLYDLDTQPSTGLAVDPDAPTIGRLFVRPGPPAEAVGRGLLREAVAAVARLGRDPVVDSRETGWLPAHLAARYGVRLV